MTLERRAERLQAIPWETDDERKDEASSNIPSPDS
jgi:hypothetical protein